MGKRSTEVDPFALKVAAVAFVGFMQAILPPIFVDPLLTTHVSYGARFYKFGYWTIPLSVVVLVLTYMSMVVAKNGGWKCFFAWLPLVCVEVPMF